MDLSFHCVCYVAQVSNSKELDTTQRPIQRKYKRIALNDITNIARDEGLNRSTSKTPSNKRRCVLSKSSLRPYVTVIDSILLDFVLILSS